MKTKVVLILACFLLLASGLSLAREASPERGNELFESPALGGGTTGRSCSSCHPGGSGLSRALFDKKVFTIMGQEKDSLEGVINVCIEKALGGTAIDPKGQDMADLVAYIKTLVLSGKKSKKKH